MRAGPRCAGIQTDHCDPVYSCMIFNGVHKHSADSVSPIFGQYGKAENIQCVLKIQTPVTFSVYESHRFAVCLGYENGVALPDVFKTAIY